MRGQKTLKDIVEKVNYDGIDDVKHMFGREKAEQAEMQLGVNTTSHKCCLLYTSPSPRDGLLSRMPSSA